MAAACCKQCSEQASSAPPRQEKPPSRVCYANSCQCWTHCNSFVLAAAWLCIPEQRQVPINAGGVSFQEQPLRQHHAGSAQSRNATHSRNMHACKHRRLPAGNVALIVLAHAQRLGQAPDADPCNMAAALVAAPCSTEQPCSPQQNFHGDQVSCRGPHALLCRPAEIMSSPDYMLGTSKQVEL